MNAVTFHLRRRDSGGFTLIEMSTAMSVLMVLGIAMILLLQQHVSFVSIFQAQTFLSDEAPKVGNLLGRIFNQADHYFVYSSRDAALAGAGPVLTDGHAVRLFFNSPTQETSERWIAMEDTDNGSVLRFYGTQADGSPLSWPISHRLTDATFRSDEGILSVTLHGPHSEEITYSGGAR